MLSLDQANELLLAPRREDNHDNKNALLAHNIDIFSPRSLFRLGSFVFFLDQYPLHISFCSPEAGKGEMLLDMSGDHGQVAARNPVPAVP